MKSPKIILYTTFYPEKDKHRRAELELVILANIQNSVISKIYILNEGGDLSFANSYKLYIIPIFKRPTYQDFFDLINAQAEADQFSVIANTDISFDGHIAILKYLDFENKCFALSRWQLEPDGKSTLYNHCDSQDTWIFKGKVKDVVSDFPMGVPRCDNRLLYELKQAGYLVTNPARSIQSYHHHEGFRPPYSEINLEHFVDPPYAYLYPHNHYNLVKTYLFNRAHAAKFASYCYDIKKINKWIPYRIYRIILKYLFRINLSPLGQ